MWDGGLVHTEQCVARQVIARTRDVAVNHGMVAAAASAAIAAASGSTAHASEAIATTAAPMVVGFRGNVPPPFIEISCIGGMPREEANHLDLEVEGCGPEEGSFSELDRSFDELRCYSELERCFNELATGSGIGGLVR